MARWGFSPYAAAGAAEPVKDRICDPGIQQKLKTFFPGAPGVNDHWFGNILGQGKEFLEELLLRIGDS
jgi:hypothetical protein